MNTQIEQLQQADRLYAISLNEPRDGMSIKRFQVYYLKDGKLDTLWPSDSHLINDNGLKAWKDKLPYQVYKKRPASGADKYPAFHFALSGCGYSKLDSLRQALQKVAGREIELEILTGWMPSRG